MIARILVRLYHLHTARSIPLQLETARNEGTWLSRVLLTYMSVRGLIHRKICTIGDIKLLERRFLQFVLASLLSITVFVLSFLGFA
jgi:hypothetical protein